MARTPAKRKSAPKKPATPRATQDSGKKTQIAARIPDEVLAGLDAKAALDGLSRNDAMIRAFLNYGHFPNGRPLVKSEKWLRENAAKAKGKPAPAAPPPAAAPAPVHDEEAV